MQKVNSLSELFHRGRVAILEGRNAAARLCEALKRRSKASSADNVYVAEASDEGSIAYAVKVEHAQMLRNDTAEGILLYAEGWLDCLQAHGVYEHLATVEAVYASPFLRQAISEIYRPDSAAEFLGRLERAYVTAKLAAAVDKVRLHDGVVVRSMVEYELERESWREPRPEDAEDVEKGNNPHTEHFSPLPIGINAPPTQLQSLLETFDNLGFGYVVRRGEAGSSYVLLCNERTRPEFESGDLETLLRQNRFFEFDEGGKWTSY